MERLDRRDWTFLGCCGAVLVASMLFALSNFRRAFPEASIDFRFDRDTSRPVAARLLAAERLDDSAMRHTATFDDDEEAHIFLERSLGLESAQNVMQHDVHLWFWHHRWFRPLQQEEWSVDVAPTGQIVSFTHTVPEDRPLTDAGADAARQTASAFLRSVDIDPAALTLAEQSERRLPHRVQRIFTWESPSIRPAGAPYRYRVSVDGTVVTGYQQRLRVPDAWRRSYRELRSRNLLAGQADSVLLILTVIAAVGVFIIRLRRRDIPLRFLAAVAIASLVLVTGVSLNSFPGALAGYETTSSYPAFLAQFVFGSLLQSVGVAMFLMVLCGAGEVLYRERLPQQLAIPRLWTPAALRSKRVFRSFVLAYTMVAFFLAYQVAFYLVASRFGAWAPAEIPYDDILNSAFPWIAVLFAGFLPALSEEFMSRAFSIPFLEKLLRSRIAAIVVAGFIWGFGHATYPNQPFYIRGVEVGCAGVMLGFIFLRYGLLPLLIWHYTVDAFYTSLLLFRSHNAYYVASAALASFVFIVPMIVAIALYIRRGGFIPDENLSNATLPVSSPPAVQAEVRAVSLPPARGLERWAVVICALLVAAAIALALFQPPSPQDAIDYRITRAQAKQIATAHLKRVLPHAAYERVIAVPVDGFRSWDASSPREDGGSPGGFDAVAAEHMLASGLTMHGLTDVFRTTVEAGTWSVRFFTPSKKDEFFVEVDPRASRALGFHEYLDERAAGPRLEKPAAIAAATPFFGVEGLDPAAFDLQEALAFQQPNRRDWLLTFQERRPIVDQAYRRVTIRVCGDVVTQFATTIKVPESVERAASTETIRNVVLQLLRVAGIIGALTLLVTGFVTVALRQRPRWGVALRWAALLSPLAVFIVVSGYEGSLFGYGTSIRWETFIAGYALDFARDLALRLAAVFLAVAMIDASFPHALDLLTNEGRRRFGRPAIIAAVTAVAAFVAARGAIQLLAAMFPAAARVSVETPDLIAASLPSLLLVAEAVIDAIVIAGIAAAFASGMASLASRRRWLAPTATIAVIFCMAVQPSATPAQTPLMLLRAAVLGVLTWVVAHFVLDDNLLAWPSAAFVAITGGGIDTMLTNHRTDLRAHAVVAIFVLIAGMAWMAFPRPVKAASPTLEP